MKTGFLPAFVLLALLQLISVHSSAQKIQNVVSEVSGTNIHIFYDLTDPPENQPVYITVFVSTDGGNSYSEPLKSVTGDVGMVIGPGKQKKIIWDVFSEVDELVSESVRFLVKADLLLSGQERPSLKPGFQFGISANLGTKVQLASFGYDVKAAVRLKQFGLGIRGEYYKSYGDPKAEDDYDHIMGFSGAAFAEYDIIKNVKYSVYPFLCIGQTKVSEQSESNSNKYAGYSIFYSAGAGFDYRLAKWILLGVELEYIMAPIVDIDDQEGSSVVDRIVLDGIWAGITLKFFKSPGK
jgi:hypothetical protein